MAQRIAMRLKGGPGVAQAKEAPGLLLPATAGQLPGTRRGSPQYSRGPGGMGVQGEMVLPTCSVSWPDAEQYSDGPDRGDAVHDRLDSWRSPRNRYGDHSAGGVEPILTAAPNRGAMLSPWILVEPVEKAKSAPWFCALKSKPEELLQGNRWVFGAFKVESQKGGGFFSGC